jgi:hypothetical protein
MFSKTWNLGKGWELTFSLEDWGLAAGLRVVKYSRWTYEFELQIGPITLLRD